MSYQNDNYSNKPAPIRWDKGFDFFTGEHLNVQWVSEYAHQFANNLSNYGLTTTQLRAFYNEFLRIRDITASSEEKIILIKLLEAKLTYRKNSGGKIPDDMLAFMRNLVDQIGDSESKFRKACYMMEAIVGFFKDRERKYIDRNQNSSTGRRS